MNEREALDRLNTEGASVAAHAADNGLGVALHVVMRAARMWDNLVSVENVEVGVNVLLNEYGKDIGGGHRPTVRSVVRGVLEAIHRGGDTR